jgi:hypothetical protein
MPRFHGQRARFGHHRGYPFQGAIWMIGIGILMLWGHWWPGIIILVGLSMILGTFWKESAPQTFEDVEQPTIPPVPPVSVPPVMQIPVVTPAPAATTHRLDLLPANCPHCGGPVRSHDVKWTGSQSAACPYCGSMLPMKKS